MPASQITDAEIDPESPLTSSLMFRLRDNPHFTLGASPSTDGLTQAEMEAIAATFDLAGTGKDGSGTSIPQGICVLDYNDFTLNSSTFTIGAATIIRCKGDFTLTNSTVTISNRSDNDYVPSWRERDDIPEHEGMWQALGASPIIGKNGQDGDAAGGGSPLGGPSGGGLFTVGGDGSADTATAPGGPPISWDQASTGYAALSAPTAARPFDTSEIWRRGVPVLGGNGGKYTGATGFHRPRGGGGLLILCNGAVDLDGTTFTADGETTTASAGVSPATNAGFGGAAGGSIIVVSLTSISEALTTYNARGSIGRALGGASNDGGGGAGGFVQRVAPSVTGTPTISVAAGGTESAEPGATGGDAGVSSLITSLTREQIRLGFIRQMDKI